MAILFRRNGEEIARVDGDDPETIYRSHPSADAVTEGLHDLIRAALNPFDAEKSVEDFEDDWVDLLQVACDYLGLVPAPQDFSGPVTGAAWRLKLPMNDAMDLEFR